MWWISVVLLIFPVFCHAQTLSLPEAIDRMDLSAWDGASGDTLIKMSAAQLVEMMTDHRSVLEPEAILMQLGSLLLRALRAQCAVFLTLSALICLSAVLGGMQGTLGGTIQDGMRIASAALCMVPALDLVQACITRCFDAAAVLARFAGAALPAVSALSCALGASGVSAMLSPLAAGAASVASLMTGTFGRPVLGLMTVLALAVGLDDIWGMEHMFDAVRSLTGWALTGILAIFACCCMVQGTQSAHLDHAALRGAKYALDHYVPVVGGLFADTFDLLAQSVLILKHAVGLAAMLILGALALEPLLTLGASMLALKLAGVFAYLTGEKQLGGMLDRLAQVLTMLCALTATCAALFLIVLASIGWCTDLAVSLG